MVAINASWGLGLAVVGGEVTPDDYLVSKITREVVREQIHTKDVEYIPGENGAVKVDVPAERRNAACLDAALIRQLVELARVVEKYFGSHQDVEWAFARGGGLHALQSRPVTAMHAVTPPKETSAMALVMSAFGAGRKE
jgi:pyruvate,water dikinase